MRKIFTKKKEKHFLSVLMYSVLKDLVWSLYLNRLHTVPVWKVTFLCLRTPSRVNWKMCEGERVAGDGRNVPNLKLKVCRERLNKNRVLQIKDGGSCGVGEKSWGGSWHLPLRVGTGKVGRFRYLPLPLVRWRVMNDWGTSFRKSCVFPGQPRQRLPIKPSVPYFDCKESSFHGVYSPSLCSYSFRWLETAICTILWCRFWEWEKPWWFNSNYEVNRIH